MLMTVLLGFKGYKEEGFQSIFTHIEHKEFEKFPLRRGQIVLEAPYKDINNVVKKIDVTCNYFK